jgi:hypothetical protein
MPTIDLTDDEDAAVTELVRLAIEDDKFPHAPGLDELRSALAKLDPRAAALRRPQAAQSAAVRQPTTQRPARAHGAAQGTGAAAQPRGGRANRPKR